MFTTFAEAQAFVRKQQFAMIDLKFTDLAGVGTMSPCRRASSMNT